MYRFATRCSSSRILCLSLFLPACSGGGGGGTTTGSTPATPRIAGTAVYLSLDGMHRMGVPDGTAVAYLADATVDDRAELFRVDRDGSHGYRVFQGTANDIVVGSERPMHVVLGRH